MPAKKISRSSGEELCDGASETTGELAGRIAHEFNNLLAVIAGYSQLLLNGLDPSSPLRPDAEQILKSVAQGTAITSRLLALSRTNGQTTPGDRGAPVRNAVSKPARRG